MNTATNAALFVLLAAGARSVAAEAPLKCAEPGAALKEMVQTEYAFAERAQSSVRDAFLQYLAEDSLVLQPAPTPGRAFYEAAKPSSDKLQWYPAAAAAGTDLGFTTGPWVYTSADGSHAYGHFVTVWKRDGQCRWRAEFDGGISHAAPATPEPKWVPGQSPPEKGQAPTAKLLASGAIGRAMDDFQHTAQQDGLGAGLRTYARDGDFRFYIEGAPPMNAGAANDLLKQGSAVASWSEKVRGHSSDGLLAYSVGEFTEAKKGGRHSYVQIWQYDSKVANWGLRLLLQSP
jgi:hypothetical protein